MKANTHGQYSIRDAVQKLNNRLLSANQAIMFHLSEVTIALPVGRWWGKNLNGHVNWDNFPKWKSGNVLYSEQVWVPNHIHQANSLDSSWWKWYSNVEKYMHIFDPSVPGTTPISKQSMCPINNMSLQTVQSYHGKQGKK